MASPVETTADEITQRLSLNIKGKVILTTGVSPGSLGAAFVETLASTAQPKLLILAGRNKSKVEATAKAIDELGTKVPTRILQLDLASLQNVRAAAAIVNGYDEPIDVLVNNAGVMACDYSTTVDGLECQFGTNHLGPWLFTNLIVNKVLSSPEGGRIVNVASDGYRLSPIRFHDYGFHGGESYSKFRAYGQAKTANLLMAMSLAEKLGPKGLIAVSLHPGVIRTNLSKHLDWSVEYPLLNALEREMGNWQGWMKSFPYVTPTQGIVTHIYASFDPILKDFNGRYLEKCSVPDLDSMYCHGISSRDASKLWKLSETLVGQKFEY